MSLNITQLFSFMENKRPWNFIPGVWDSLVVRSHLNSKSTGAKGELPAFLLK
jgi:hypothetical protein